MKRSMINRTIREAMAFFAERNFRLPPFAFYRKDDWEKHLDGAEEIFDLELGWDVTGFGKGDFERFGLTLFTLRNGRRNDPRYPKSYAEKFILDPDFQCAPAHFHRSKREDIINRGKGFIVLELTASDPDGNPAGGSLTVAVDGISRTIPSGSRVRLKPGESICLVPGTIHQFWGEGPDGILIDGERYGVSGEVSSVCDDISDNVFIHGGNRFPGIDEDEEKICYLCNEYPAASAD